MNVIFKGVVYNKEIQECNIMGCGKILNKEPIHRYIDVKSYEIILSKPIEQIKLNVYQINVGNNIDLDCGTVKIEKISNDLDGNIIYYTDYIIRDSRH